MKSRQSCPDNRSVTDQLFLSIWLIPQTRRERLRLFEKALRSFPFSQREQPQSAVLIQGISVTEPPLLERPLNGPLDVDALTEIFRDYEGPDIAYVVDSWWDLWQFDGDWQLQPTHVTLSCFGAEFDNGTERAPEEQEDLRIDFGVDSSFLPRTEVEGGARLIESNIKSLLRLVHELERILPIETRRLETESGENFADRLQRVLSGGGRFRLEERQRYAARAEVQTEGESVVRRACERKQRSIVNVIVAQETADVADQAVSPGSAKRRSVIGGPDGVRDAAEPVEASAHTDVLLEDAVRENPVYVVILGSQKITVARPGKTFARANGKNGPPYIVRDGD